MFDLGEQILEYRYISGQEMLVGSSDTNYFLPDIDVNKPTPWTNFFWF